MTAIQKFLKRNVKNYCVLHDLQGLLQKEKEYFVGSSKN